jgi:hypothetical protein
MLNRSASARRRACSRPNAARLGLGTSSSDKLTVFKSIKIRKSLESKTFHHLGKFIRDPRLLQTTVDMAGPVRQPIDISALENYITKNVSAISIPITLKQVHMTQPRLHHLC